MSVDLRAVVSPVARRKGPPGAQLHPSPTRGGGPSPCVAAAGPRLGEAGVGESYSKADRSEDRFRGFATATAGPLVSAAASHDPQDTHGRDLPGASHSRAGPATGATRPQ